MCPRTQSNNGFLFDVTRALLFNVKLGSLTLIAGFTLLHPIHLMLCSFHIVADQCMVICSVPLNKAGAEPKGCLHTALSLPGEMVVSEQVASPPVRVPKGLRSNRLRKQASSLSSSLGVIKSAGTAKAAKVSSQGDYIKVGQPCIHSE